MHCKSLRWPLLFALFALSASAAWAGNAKVKVCHIPPGNPANFHTITISDNALQAHLAHGDLAGACAAHCETLCNDGNACTIDACDSSERCIANHPPVNCDDGNLCTTDSCDPATGCASVPKLCLDGDNCTVDACDPLSGGCVAPPVVCPAGQSCNADTGSCESAVTCPCTSVPKFNSDLQSMNNCESFMPGELLFGVGAFDLSFVDVAQNRCGHFHVLSGYSLILPVTPEETEVCLQLLLDAAARNGAPCPAL